MNNANKHNEIPLGLSMALAQSPAALDNYAQLADTQRNTIIAAAARVSSKEEMQALVHGLENGSVPKGGSI